MENGFEGYRERIEEGLRKVLDERERHDPLYHPIEHMLGIGGKRMRPVAVMIACEAFEGDPSDALHPALGIELFHNFTLMHDDLMDEAPLRRGEPTVYHRSGRNMAVLSGDAMFVKAYQQMLHAEPSLITPLLEDFNRAALEVCEGQRTDMAFEERGDVGIEEYLRMIASKTAALLGAALKIGGRIAGAAGKDLERLELMGRDLGMAFQIQDDLLDVYGDEGKFGKRKGGDIVAGKKTYLLIRAFEKADEGQRECLKNALADTEAERKVEDVIRIYDELGVRVEARERSEAYFEEALAVIQELSVEEARKAPLRSLVEMLRVRES